MIHPANWIKGVDYENGDNKNNNDADNKYDGYNIDKDKYEEGYEDNKDIIDEDQYEPIDDNEVGNLSQSPPMLVALQEAPDNKVLEGMAAPPINILDGNTVFTNPLLVSEPMVPTRRGERNATRPAKYSHMQIDKKQVSFSDDAILQSVEQCHAILCDKTTKTKKYNCVVAPVIACIITDINEQASAQGVSFSQQYMVQKGIKKFGTAGSQAAVKELDQLLERNCFMPIDVSTMTAVEKLKSVNSLLFLMEKCSEEVKGSALDRVMPIPCNMG